jgi:heptaprenyl diphosphate synthase
VAKDITAVHDRIFAKRDSVHDATIAAVDLACEPDSRLREAVHRLVDSDASGSSVFRLLPFAVLGALGQEVDAAVAVCVPSRLWWVGAQALDDLMDGHFDCAAVGLTTAEATIASITCISLLPQLVIPHLNVPAAVVGAWARETLDASLRAASGQFDDVSAGEDDVSWRRVIKGYAGKSGAPYARDVAMTAMLALAGADEVRGWRAFGNLFGVLRQLANDRVPRAAEHDEDLANGTPTLLLAQLLETAEPHQRAELVALRARATEDVTARLAMRDRMMTSAVHESYQHRVHLLRRQCSALLSRLAPPSEHRDLIAWMVATSAGNATRKHVEA